MLFPKSKPVRRSGFQRAVYVAPPAPPLRRVERTGVIRAVGEEVVSVPKPRILRSKAYRMWVASLPCVVCGIEKLSQCAHSNQAKHGKAGARKASDEFTFPLCATRPGHMGHHVEHDLCIGMTGVERDELEDRYIERTQAMAREAGRREFEKEAA